MSDTWLPNWFQISNLFHPLERAGKHFQVLRDWPSLQDLNQWDKERTPITFVPQLTKFQQLAQQHQYEIMIYLKQQIQTRTKNWHDFFNAIIWKTFIKTKKQINLHQFKSLKYREKHKTKDRLPIENFLTHFDECGLIVLSTNSKWFDLIKNHAWQEIFWQQRMQLQKEVQFIVFGHSIYEKGLNPYLGLTAKAIFMNLPINTPQEHIDTKLCSLLKNGNSDIYRQKLQPVPILGIPGWHPDNQLQDFYQNKKYFRPKIN